MSFILALLTAFLPLRAHAQSFEALRSVGLRLPAAAPDAAPAAIEGRPVPGDPAWFVMEGEGPDFDSARVKLLAALKAIAKTPTGAGLMEALNGRGGRVILRPNGSFCVPDSEQAFVAGPEMVNQRSAAQLIALVAHELEHVRQVQSGLKSERLRAVRELAAVLVQSRVWVEAGAPLAEQDWARNENNSQDMWTWLEHPYSLMTALCARGGYSMDLTDEALRRYWERVLADEAAWRPLWRKRFPQGRSSGDAALFVLDQASRFADWELDGAVSQWLPGIIEAAAALRSGSALHLPAEPSAKDRVILRSLPFPARLEPAGQGWVLKRS